jgi:hypothetical protein
MRGRFTELVRLLETGAAPQLTARQRKDVEKGKLRLK